MVNKVLLKPNNEQKYLVQGASQDLFVLDLSNPVKQLQPPCPEFFVDDICFVKVILNLSESPLIIVLVGDNFSATISLH